MVEIEGMINSQPIFILIDIGAILSYISPRIVELCKLVLEKINKPWLVDLAIGTKREVTIYVKDYELLMNNFITHANLNILPLGSYDMLIGMDWIEKHKVMLNWFYKTLTYTNDIGTTIKVKGISRKVTIREISTLQMKRYIRKGCKVFVVYIMNDNDNKSKLKIEDIPVLNEFEDIFLKEVIGLPPKRDIDFTIDLIPGAILASKYPYRMNMIEFRELKSQLQELIDKIIST